MQACARHALCQFYMGECHIPALAGTAADMQEEALIRLAQRGDTDAFTQLIATHEKRVYNIALKFMRNDTDAQDAAQDAIIKIYRNIGKYSFRAAFSTWVYRLTVNACLDLLRRKKEEQSFEGAELFLQSSEGLPDRDTLKRELSDTIKSAVLLLSEKYMPVIVLRDIDGMKYEEIAQILRISVGTVKSRLARGRDKLRELLVSAQVFA